MTVANLDIWHYNARFLVSELFGLIIALGVIVVKRAKRTKKFD